MKIRVIIAALLILSTSEIAVAQSSIIKPTAQSLMNEVRITPSPLNGEVVKMNPARFMWPDQYPHLGTVLDGVAQEAEAKPAVTYRIRISQDPKFKRDVIEGECNWAFFNPFQKLNYGKWYWQYAFVEQDGAERWSELLSFTMAKDAIDFNPPSFEAVVATMPTSHPRILLDGERWDQIIEAAKENPEAQQYYKVARKAISHPLKHISEEIDTTALAGLSNKSQYRSRLIREGRKIVDREERYIEALTRSYLLTQKGEYFDEALRRFKEVISWDNSRYFAGDFNMATLLLLSTSLYDSGFNSLSAHDKELLEARIAKYSKHFYEEYVNHLENRIADNHVWQMTLRILTMGSFSILGQNPEAEQWARYCYNVWVSRFPGLNSDGSWHNGDSYFHVNMRTLIEVPLFYSRISGFDFFADPWYSNNALYTIYHQPPFSKSAGHGSSHESKRTPNGAKVGYMDAVARQTGNKWAAAYVSEILKEDPAIFATSFMSKSGDLTWYRCTTDKAPIVAEVELKDLPTCKVFNENGVATMHSSLGDHKTNAMLSFRSSPYGSTSHAQANQNAFNTFYGGKEIFYSSGHRTGFTDNHAILSYRNTRAHNTIMVDDKCQRIGTDGYGWIPRYYEGEKISYIVGDASNAYGKVGTPLWLKRAELSEIEFSPENGWDDNKVELFRRHVIQLDGSGVVLIYDELEATEPVEWSYLLHTLEYKMGVKRNAEENLVRVAGKNSKGGVSTAYIYSSSPVTTAVSDQFFAEPIDWLGKHKGEFAPQWHFTAKSKKVSKANFLTILDTRHAKQPPVKIERNGDSFVVNGWQVKASLNGGAGAIKVVSPDGKAKLSYDIGKNQGKTSITDSVNGKSVKQELVDQMPNFEI